MSIAQYGRKFPVLLRMSNPRGQVELLETIGKGNYGYVYKGKLLKKQNELTAVKVVFLKEDEIKETLLEMEILQACDHPNITKFFGSYLKGLDLWICMEFCGAGSVDSIYRAFKKQIPEEAIASILHDTFLALEYIHTKVGLIHRDIKAGNILLTEDGQVKLADFGVSAKLKNVGGKANTFIGTPYWMAPEVIKCDPESKTGSSVYYTDKSDVWSMGITAIEIAEKNPPLSDIHPMQALTMIPTSDKLKLEKPEAFTKPFVTFVNFLIVKNPDKRPSATESLQHPFMLWAQKLPRAEILTELVRKAANIKEKKKAGKEITDEDEYGPPAKASVANAPAATTSTASTPASDTLNKKAKAILSNLVSQASFNNSVKTSNSGSTAGDISTLPSIDDFPTVANNVQEGITCIFEPVILTTLAEVLTADFLDGRYILIGTEKGLFYLDIQKPNLKVPILLIADTRFRQIRVLGEYNVLIALSGKHDHIRQYNLGAIRKLILYIEGNSAVEISKSNTDVPMQSIQIGKLPVTEYDYLNSNSDMSEEALLDSWANDFIKIVNTRNTREFQVDQTETTAYLVILGQEITLFRWAVEPYNKFMKIKSFWMPETPKLITLANDGMSATELFLVYSSELNRVSINDSKVTELKVHKEMKAKTFGKQRWQSFLQIPFSDAKLEQILRQNFRGTVNRKLAAVTGPTLARPTQVPECYFLGTYDRLTKVVDRNSFPMVGAGVAGWKDGVMWSEVPTTQILRPLQHVITVGKNTIEIVEWKSASLRQRMTVDNSCSFRVLTSAHGQTLVSVDKKKTGSMLYWMMESTPGPRAVGEIMANILREQAPVNLLEGDFDEDDDDEYIDKIASNVNNLHLDNKSKTPTASVHSKDQSDGSRDHETYHEPEQDLPHAEGASEQFDQQYDQLQVEVYSNGNQDRHSPLGHGPNPATMSDQGDPARFNYINAPQRDPRIPYDSRSSIDSNEIANYPRMPMPPRPMPRPGPPMPVGMAPPRPYFRPPPPNMQYVDGSMMRNPVPYRPDMYRPQYAPRYPQPGEPYYGTLTSQASSVDPRFVRPQYYNGRGQMVMDPRFHPGNRPPMDPRFARPMDPRMRPPIPVDPRLIDPRLRPPPPQMMDPRMRPMRPGPMPVDPRFYRPPPRPMDPRMGADPNVDRSPTNSPNRRQESE